MHFGASRAAGLMFDCAAAVCDIPRGVRLTPAASAV